MKRPLVVVIFLFWIVTIIGAYYVVQKPDLIHSVGGINDTFWTLIVAIWLLFNAGAIGRNILVRLGSNFDEAEHLLLGTGIGLGALGLLGLWISAAQIANVPVLLTFQFILGVFFFFRKDHLLFINGIKAFSTEWKSSFKQFSVPSKFAVTLPFILSFLLTLAPQIEAFDAPLYHLTQPAQIIKDGGLRPFDNMPFWFPNLSENMYLWTLGMGSERAAQIIHLTWGTLAILLLWRWSTKTWD
ncbi:MAG TPA: hypothetical protein VLT51_10700, partial [Anaerolineales bacterium]|nr:hypothetical protein [Anaerolineales bacterium]